MTSKYFLLTALLGAAAGLVGPGCSKDGDNIVIYQTANTPQSSGTLNATPWYENAFSGDDLSFSETSVGVNVDGSRSSWNYYCRLDTSGLRCFWNRGRAIVIYAASRKGDDNEHYLWASYFNGATFTPPVRLRAQDQDQTDTHDPFDGLRVAWFNTASFSGTTGAATSAGRARNGDAIVLWDCLDEDDAPNNNDEANRNLYMTYFDVSLSGSGANNWGFDQWAIQVNSGSDTTANTGTDDVTKTYGFVSDGLIGEAYFSDQQEGDIWQFGDAVSFLVIAYIQDVEALSSGGGQISDRRLLTKVVNIGSTTDTASNRAPLLGTETRVNPPSTNAETVGATNGNEETNVNPTLRVYNSEIFYTITDNEVTATGTDTPLCWNQFNASTGAWLANSLRVNGTDDNPNDAVSSGLVQMGQIFGADEGLVSTFSCYSSGGGTDDTDIFMLQTPPVGAAFGAADRVEVDNELDAVGDNDPASLLGAIINRDGTWIAVAFTQDDTAGATDSVTVHFASAFQTVRSGSRVNMNAASVPFTVTPTKITNLAAGDAILEFEAVEEYGYRGIQSNRLILNGFYVVNPSAGVTEEEIFRWSLTVTLGTATPTPSLATASVAVANATFDTGVAAGNERIGVDPNANDRQVQAWDNGAGGSIIVWVQETASNTGNGTDYYEIKINDGTTTQDFTSDDDDRVESFLEGGMTLPKNPDINGSPSWGGRTLHLLVNGPAFGGGNNQSAPGAVWHRAWDKTSTAATFAAQFTPALTSSPNLVSDSQDLDDGTLTGIDANSAGISARRHIVWSGEQLGVFWANTRIDDQESNSNYTPSSTIVYYSQWANGSWAAPTVVEDNPAFLHTHGFDVCWTNDPLATDTRTGAIISVLGHIGEQGAEQFKKRLLLRRMH